MLRSLSGQNESMARIGAHRPPPTASPGQGGGGDTTNGAASAFGPQVNAPAVNAPAGGTRITAIVSSGRSPSTPTRLTQRRL